MIKLYSHPLSTFSRRVRIALIERGIEVETINLDMANGEHRAPAYRALNPTGRVPTIVDDGLVLYESTAILEYLEATHRERSLWPADPKLRALVSMHMKLCDVDFTRHVATIIFPKRFLPKERWDAAAFASARREIAKHFARLEGYLAGKEYLVEGRFTLAEVCYLPFLEFMPLLEVEAPPAIAAWSQRLLSRPSALETKPAH